MARNYEDAYTDPGSPATRKTSRGTYVLALVDGQRKLLLQGAPPPPSYNSFWTRFQVATSEKRGPRVTFSVLRDIRAACNRDLRMQAAARQSRRIANPYFSFRRERGWEGESVVGH